jgi:hypothetical protein
MTKFSGVDSRGIGRGGVIPPGVSVTEFVEAKYVARWRRLTVTRGEVEVGGVGPDLDTGRRTWWAEA